MGSKCTPPLNVVANGSAGSAFPAPLDANDVPLNNQQPSFTQIACETLADACQAADPISAIDDLPAIADAIDTLSSAADTQLAAILEELDSVVGTQDAEQSFSDFAGAQPGATSLLGDFTSLPTPALAPIPMTYPDGRGAVTFGAPPQLGGPARAGGAEYQLLVPVLAASPTYTPNIKVLNMSGPNPPLVSAGQFERATINGALFWVVPVTINPAHKGQFQGVIYWQFTGTFAFGFSGTLQRQYPFEVVIE